MEHHNQLLTPEVIQMLVSSVTQQGQNSLTELEAERLLNAIARVQSNVPTGALNPTERRH